MKKEFEIALITANELLATKGNELLKEIDIKDKRISLLTETLASRDKDIETLKAEIMRQNTELLQNTQVIERMAAWISNQDIDELICKDVTDGACGDENGRPCIECVIEWFKGEVKE